MDLKALPLLNGPLSPWARIWTLLFFALAGALLIASLAAPSPAATAASRDNVTLAGAVASRH